MQSHAGSMFQNISGFINKSFQMNIGKMDIAPTYWQAGAVIFLIFLLILTLARLRHVYVNWSLKGAWPMIFFGFMLALILEGFLILSGRTLLTELLGWENAPKPISTALDEGKNRLVDVLGVTDTIPNSSASQSPTVESIISDFGLLGKDDSQRVREQICSP